MLCHRYGLPIDFVGIGHGFVGAVQTSNQGRVAVALPGEELQRRIDEAKEAVDIAILMGAPLIRLFGGSVPEGSENREALWETMSNSFQQLCDYAAEKGILIGLHNHPPAVASTSDAILRILDDVNRENFTFILDTGQWWGPPRTNRAGAAYTSVDIYQYMEQSAPHASYVRAKIYKMDSGQEELLDYKRIIPILRSVKFNGNMSIVFEDRGNQCDYVQSIGIATTHLRKLLEDTVND